MTVDKPKNEKWGRGNNLIMQDKNAIYNEKIRKNIYYSYIHHFSDFKNTMIDTNLSYLKIIIGYL